MRFTDRFTNRDGDSYIEMAFDVKKGNGTSQPRAIVEVVFLFFDKV